ncbi:MAG: HTH domain-containing protein [Acidilobaceae archaeon]|nr:HTH domain-containing protein [Acidilobaceae archaeon]
MRVKVSLEGIAEMIRESRVNYVTVQRLSSMLGVSTRSAGKILARLEEEGAVKRYSNRAYKVIYSPAGRRFWGEG